MLRKAKYVSRIDAGVIRPLQQQSVSKRVIVFGTLGTGKVVDVMAIKVMYHNDTYDEVDPSLLDDLISSHKVKKFLRSKGWATVGIDPVRQTLRGRIPNRTAEPRRKREAALPDHRGTAVPNGEFQPLFESAPALFLVLNQNFQIVAVTDAYLRATMTRRGDILGHDIFEIFPDNPDDLNATGVRNLRTSLLRVLQNRKPDVMPVQKYDIRRSAEKGGSFEERYWCPVNAPVLGADNEVKYLIHRVEDVTKFITFRKKELERHKLTQELRERMDRMEAEIYARTQEVAEMNLHLKEVNAQLRQEHDKLQEALANVQQLSGMLPICASCKKIRDDTGYWTQVETYIHQHSQADFTHSICPECAAKLYPDIFPDDQGQRA